MLRRLSALFDRYSATHLTLRGAGRSIRDSAGQPVGHVDIAELHQGRLRIAGWVRAEKVTLHLAGETVSMAPRQLREDVASATGGSPAVGFDLILPCQVETLLSAEAPGLSFVTPQRTRSIPSLPMPMPRPQAARRRLRLRFAAAGLLTVPAVLGWAMTRDPRFRARVKARLGLSGITHADPMESRLFRTAEDRPAQPGPVRITIVLPVYNAFDLLAEVLDRVRRNTDLPWRLIVIEDCSPDPRVRPFLRNWVATQEADRPGRVVLIENPENRGFIGSVNTGLATALTQTPPADGTPEGPVVLLNSDAFVPQGWASRLVRPMLLHENVASVTPLSNDAEIFSTPMLCEQTPLRPGQGDAIDAVAQGFHPDALISQVPTGVGFCMAMGRDWLRRVPALDTAFGRGYGEEVDWCQKVRRRGGRHLGLPGLFVEHRGGESFGSAAKLALVARNNEIIARRYPQYDAEVQGFISHDPLLTARLALALAWAGSLGAEIPVYLAHSLGGGAEMYLRQRIAGDIDRIGAAVVLRIGGRQRWQLEVVGPHGTVAGTTDDFELVQRMLQALKRSRIVYSCGVGDRDPLTLPDRLRDLKRGPQDKIEVLIHDFYPVSPSYTLLDADGVYRGPVTAERDDPAHRGRDAAGNPVPLADWQAAWGGLLRDADEIRAFSEDSAAQIRAVWSGLDDRIRVLPHALLAPMPLLTAPDGAPLVIGVLGNIGRQKGAELVSGLARRLEGRRDLALALIGNIDPNYPMPGSAPVHGDYRHEDLETLARRYRIGAWLIPSIWPETFSYTTHEALATGLPVLAFALGAQGAAVAAAPNGIAIAYTPEDDLVDRLLEVLTDNQALQAAKPLQEIQ